jgi:hypothetical protein
LLNAPECRLFHRWKQLANRLFAASFVASLVVGAAAVIPTAATTAAAASAPIYWGSYVNGAPGKIAAINQFEADAGKKQSIVHWGQAWQWNGAMQPFLTKDFEAIRLRGSIPMVNWDSWSLGDRDSDPNYTLARIYNGSYDAYITAWAQDAKAWGHPFFVRFDHEMNGSWYPWSEQANGNHPGDYVKAWRHVVDIFRQVGATNATWVWCIIIEDNVTTPITELYPGDAYVDWTAVDGYNRASSPSSWLSFNQVFGLNPWGKHNTYQDLLTVAPSKPIMIAETATTDTGGDPAAWIKDAYLTQLPQLFPQIKAVVWFNWSDNDPTNTYQIETTPTKQAAFQQAISSSYYASNTFASLPAGPIQPPGPPADTQAPTQPTGLSATAASSTQIALSWTKATDNVGVAGYNIFRDGATTPLNSTLVTATTFTDAGLVATSAHTYTLQAQDASGNKSPLSSPASATTQAAAPVSPVVLLSAVARLADTRTTLPAGAIAARTTRCFTVAGQSGIPSDAAGVVLNLTALGPTGQGWLTLFPNGQSVPATSTLNFQANQFAIANNATVRVGTSGQVCVNAGQAGTNVLLDAVGYVPSANAALMPLLTSPARLVDTRSSGGAIVANTSRCFTVAGQGGIPSTATGVVLNITSVGYTGSGWLTAYPSGGATPATSTLNFDSREWAIANNTYLKLGTNGQVCVAAGQSASQVIVDAVGYMTTAGLAGMPLLTTPQRLVNTTVSGGPIAAGTNRCFVIAGQKGIPSTATGVLINVTATGHTADGTLTAYASGLRQAGLPATLSFDISTESAIPNGTLVPLGSDGQLCISAAQSSAQAIVDVTGYLP